MCRGLPKTAKPWLDGRPLPEICRAFAESRRALSPVRGIEAQQVVLRPVVRPPAPSRAPSTASMMRRRSCRIMPLQVQEGATPMASNTSISRQIPMRCPYSRRSSWRCRARRPAAHAGWSPVRRGQRLLLTRAGTAPVFDVDGEDQRNLGAVRKFQRRAVRQRHEVVAGRGLRHQDALRSARSSRQVAKRRVRSGASSTAMVTRIKPVTISVDVRLDADRAEP